MGRDQPRVPVLGKLSGAVYGATGRGSSFDLNSEKGFLATGWGAYFQPVLSRSRFRLSVRGIGYLVVSLGVGTRCSHGLENLSVDCAESLSRGLALNKTVEVEGWAVSGREKAVADPTGKRRKISG